jgi:hypothetical protein
MATDNVTKSAYNTLSTTVADTVNLLQFWDRIEVSNTGTTSLYVTFDGTTPTAALDNADIVEPSVTKIFSYGIIRADGAPGSTTTPCHVVKVVGSGNTYGIVGVAGK